MQAADTRKNHSSVSTIGQDIPILAPPRVAIVILNWNRCQDTLECLASLRKLDYQKREIVVVDNASSDGTPTAIRAQFPQVTLLENATNLGYAEGNNVGLQFARQRGADYVLLLNNDTIVQPQFLTELLQVALIYPDSGVLGPLIYYFDKPHVIWSAGGGIDWRSGHTWMIGLNEEDRGQYVEPREVDFVSGCAMLVRADVIERVGFLDRRFFTYYEEVEYCTRVRRAGFRVRHVPAAKIWHKISPADQLVSPRIAYYMTRNRLLFLSASRAGLGPLLCCLVENARTLASWSLRPRHRNRRGQRGAIVRGIIDFALGRFGGQVPRR